LAHGIVEVDLLSKKTLESALVWEWKMVESSFTVHQVQRLAHACLAAYSSCEVLQVGVVAAE
jgi:hypothetical protein